MATLVGAMASSHSSLMVSGVDGEDDETRERCLEAYSKGRRFLEDTFPDVIVVIGTDHFNTFSLDLFPQYCIGVGAIHEGWGDNMPSYTVKGLPDFAEGLATGMVEQNFDISYALDMRLDHSFMSPLHFLTPNMEVPVTPLFQNTLASPMLRPSRAWDAGVALRCAIEEYPQDLRVFVLGSGGLSHWLGGPEHGRLNPAFDSEFVDRFVKCDSEWLRRLSSDYLDKHGGNGAQEVRNWLSVRSALEAGHAEVIWYEPVPEWVVGFGIATITP